MIVLDLKFPIYNFKKNNNLFLFQYTRPLFDPIDYLIELLYNRDPENLLFDYVHFKDIPWVKEHYGAK